MLRTKPDTGTALTPGEWTAEEYASPKGRWFVRANGKMVNYPLNGADARLIAAAPDLLGVAKRILERGYVSESIEEERGDHLALAAAISKAEGRS